MWRKGLSWLHRWSSLAAGLVLVVMGLSGSLLVWQAELDAALNPGWFKPLAACDTWPTTPPAQTQPTVAQVLLLLQQHAPGRRAAIVVAPHEPGAAYQVWERRDAQGVRREHFIDPVCGRYLGFRDRGLVKWDAAHLVPTVYELHRYFWSGEAGATVAGTGGLVLFGLGLSGLVLVWPRQALRWASWQRVLTIRWDSAPARRWYDVHRTVGLWLAPLLLLLSLTGAALVFGDTTRTWVGALLPTQADARLPRMKASAATQASSDEQASTTEAKANSTATATATATAETHALTPDEWVMRAQQEFPQAQWSRLTLPTGTGPVEVRLLQPGEPRADTGNTRVRLSPQGKLLSRYDPLHAPAGNVLLNWLFPLHSAEAFGWAARMLWSVFGGVPALLLGTGLWLWWRRRRAAARQPSAAPMPQAMEPNGPSAG
jgi:uncharacterized iron-regulated membrane protein